MSRPENSSSSFSFSSFRPCDADYDDDEDAKARQIALLHFFESICLGSLVFFLTKRNLDGPDPLRNIWTSLSRTAQHQTGAVAAPPHIRTNLIESHKYNDKKHKKKETASFFIISRKPLFFCILFFLSFCVDRHAIQMEITSASPSLTIELKTSPH